MTSRLGTALRIALIVIGFSPVLTWLLGYAALLEPLTVPLQAWFEFQCHQDPARSLAWLGAALPVCMRCLGIYLGLGLGALLLWPKLKPSELRGWVIIAALLLVADVASVTLALRPSLTSLRFITGFALSYPVGVALVRAAASGPKMRLARRTGV
jgi:uncharacterized membrane protein